jgi:aspartyl-tRNA(Asn)/glutamyl-tRNA(Gln) amidotransferase subunit B
VEDLRSRLPELATQRKNRFVQQLGLPKADARQLTDVKAMADYFEAALALKPGGGPALAKSVSNWMLGDLMGLVNASGADLDASRITPGLLREFTDLVEAGAISGPAAKTVLEEMFKSGKQAQAIAEEQGLTQISDAGLLDGTVADVLDRNDQAVQDYLGGKETALKFLVGQVMKETRGRASPALVNEMLQEKLASIGGG